MSEEEAQILALQALAWLAGQEELWQGFLGETGMATEQVRQMADQPGLLGAVLDYLTRHDDWVTAFCDARDLAYTAPMAARQALAGGPLPHWT